MPTDQELYDAFLKCFGPDGMLLLMQDQYNNLLKKAEEQPSESLEWRLAKCAHQAAMPNTARVHFNWLANHAADKLHRDAARYWLETN